MSGVGRRHAHRRHEHPLRVAEPALILVPTARARIAIPRQADANVAKPVAGATAGDDDHVVPQAEHRVGGDELVDERVRGDHLRALGKHIALRNLDPPEETAGQFEIGLGSQPRTGAVFPILMNDECGVRHDVEHAVDHAFGDKWLEAGPAPIGISNGILGPETVQDESVRTLARLRIALRVLMATGLGCAVGG